MLKINKMEMKKTILALSIFLTLNVTRAQQFYQNGMEHRVSNLTSVTPPEVKLITDELNSLTPIEARNNPDYGVLAETSPCTDCIELIQKRTENTRYYVKKGTNGSGFMLSKGYFPINYRDNNGFLRAINERLKPDPTQPKLYTAPSQKWPTKIDAGNKFSSLTNSGKEFKFNQNLRLLHKDAIGNVTVLGNADWSNYTVGSQGALITNIFPNVDLKILVFEGEIKTDFIIKQPLGLTGGGWLVIEDDMGIPSGMAFSTSNAQLNSDGQWVGNIDLVDQNNPVKFTINEGFADDNTSGNPQRAWLGYKVYQNKFEIYLPVNWLGQSSRQYPVTIDPTVQTSGTNVAINGQGAGYDNTFVTGCFYTLSVNTPANCTITNIYWSVQYTTFNPCRGGNGASVYGGMIFNYLGCRSPAPPSLWGCALNAFVVCSPPALPGISCCTPAGNGNFLSCVPAPQCAPYPMNFTMNFVQGNYAAYPGCNPACYRITSNWVMTIEGETVAQPPTPTSSNGFSFCLGGCTNLTATGTWGVPPYTYLWMPGGGTTNPMNVCPSATTTYTCTITDVCGNTAIKPVTITITGCLPIELVDYKVNYNNDSATIIWETATEHNSDYFSLEKSYDGVKYELLSKVTAAGNSNSNKYYSVNDINPNKNGATYYRLKQFDKGNSEAIFSKVITLNTSEKINELLVIPNPASSNVILIMPDNLLGKLVYIDIYDNTGRKVVEAKSEITRDNNSFNFSVSNLPDAIYFIKVSDNLGTIIRKKLVKE